MNKRTKHNPYWELEFGKKEPYNPYWMENYIVAGRCVFILSILLIIIIGILIYRLYH